jgi:mannose-1-phosphate guanylyltransferase
MRGILLAAGYGTRLAPLTNSIPKCLVPIRNKPLLGYWLDMLLPHHLERVLINTHYLPKIVESYVLQHQHSIFIDIAFEERLLGTAGTLLKNKSFFGEDDFFVAHADNLTKFNLGDFIRTHQNRPKFVDITMMTFETDAPSTCGIVEIDSIGVVTGFYEKVKNPPSNLANAAVYIMTPQVLQFISEQDAECIDISNDVLPKYLGRIQTFHNHEYHRDIGTPESLTRANIDFL